jgi:homoserine acetyltransferase
MKPKHINETKTHQIVLKKINILHDKQRKYAFQAKELKAEKYLKTFSKKYLKTFYRNSLIIITVLVS